jgi:hypothetical protein
MKLEARVGLPEMGRAAKFSSSILNLKMNITIWLRTLFDFVYKQNSFVSRLLKNLLYLLVFKG